MSGVVTQNMQGASGESISSWSNGGMETSMGKLIKFRRKLHQRISSSTNNNNNNSMA
jgi:hypothetical protein